MSTANAIRAWHDNLALRADAIARMRAHAEADAIIQGSYLDINSDAPGGYRGCFYGCLVTEVDPTLRRAIADAAPDTDYEDEPDGGWHGAAERLLGLPQRFGRLAEGIFESLPRAEAPAFAVAITEAIGVGVDLDRVGGEMVIRILADPEHGCRQYADPDGQAAIDTVVGLHRRRLAGDEPAEAEWAAAESAARSAESAAWSTTESAARSAESAARSAESAAWSTTESAARRWQADTLIALTRDALVAAR